MRQPTHLPAIPTLYKGVRYRSRLEARWSAFFDALGWRHEYEPIELSYYVPDFLLHFDRPVLVECKPFIDARTGDAQDALTACRRIESGGWTGDALLVGAALHFEPIAPTHNPAPMAPDGTAFEAPTVTEPPGMHITIGRIRVEGDVWRDAYLGRDNCPRDVWFPTPDAVPISSMDAFAARMMWADAGNVTQWKARR